MRGGAGGWEAAQVLCRAFPGSLGGIFAALAAALHSLLPLTPARTVPAQPWRTRLRRSPRTRCSWRTRRSPRHVPPSSPSVWPDSGALHATHSFWTGPLCACPAQPCARSASTCLHWFPFARFTFCFCSPTCGYSLGAATGLPARRGRAPRQACCLFSEFYF